jgi:hypothetical protein
MSNYLVSIATTSQQRRNVDRPEDDCTWGETCKLYRRNLMTSSHQRKEITNTKQRFSINT